MKAEQRSEPKIIPTSFPDEDLHVSKETNAGKKHGGKSKMHSKKVPQSTLVEDELFQLPRSIPVGKTSKRKIPQRKAVHINDEDDILLQNHKTGNGRKRRPDRESYPSELLYDINRSHSRPVSSNRHLKRLQGRYFNSVYDSSRSLTSLKRFLADCVSTPSITKLHKNLFDAFRANLDLEVDITLQPRIADALKSNLKPLSKSSLLVAQNIDDPSILKRAFVNQQLEWKTERPLDVLVNGFYSREPNQFAACEYEVMAAHMQEIVSDCKEEFNRMLRKISPSGQDLTSRDTSMKYEKFEETGHQIYRQVTQYMNFLAGTKAMPKVKQNEQSAEKSHDVKIKDKVENSALKTPKSPTDSKTTPAFQSKTLFPIVNDTTSAPSRNSDITDLSSSNPSKKLALKKEPVLSYNDQDNKESMSQLEDGELPDNMDENRASAEPNTPRPNDLETDEGPFQVEVQPDKGDEAGDSSDRDSVDEDGVKKKKKKRKKSKSSSSKKEKKKKKKEKKEKDREMPKAYASNTNDRPGYNAPMMRDQNRPMYVRRGFHQYHNRGGFRNFRYNNNFRFRGRGGANWRPYNNNPMNRNYNQRFQHRPAGIFSHQRMLREKRFVSESSSDGERDYSLSKGRRPSSQRKSISETGPEEVAKKFASNPSVGGAGAQKSEGIGDTTTPIELE